MAGELVERLRKPWDGTAGARARRDAERAEAADRIESLEREIATLRAAAYCETDKGPVLWSVICQQTIDDMEWQKSSLNPVWKQVRQNELERAAQIADNYLPSTFDTKAIAAAIRNMGGEG